MTQPRGPQMLVEALRAAVAESPALRAGQLRPRLESRLGSEQSRLLRRELHQVVAAAEEHLPARLLRVTPLSPPALSRLSAELAAARGWSASTAERTVRIWAAATGHEDLAGQEWPVAADAPVRPYAAVDPGLGVTARPPEASRAEPRGQPVRPAAPPPRGPRPQGPPVLQRSDRSAPDVGWPTPSKRLAAAHPSATTGEPALGVAQAYGGVSLPAFAAVAATLTAGLVALALLLPGLAVILAPVGAGVAALSTRLLRYGALVATASGLEFVPYDGNMRRAHPERSLRTPWSLVTGETGRVSRLAVAGRRLQLGPRGRGFAAAALTAAARSGGGRRDLSP